MKNIMIYAVIAFMASVICACDDKKDCEFDDDIKGISVIEMYKFNEAEVLLTAAEHKITLQLFPIEESTGYPPSWDFQQIAMWDETLPGEDKWLIYGMTYGFGIYDGADYSQQNECDLGWIKLERVEKADGTPDLRITVLPNESGKYRASRITVAYEQFENTYYMGQVIVGQKAAPDQESFTVTARYKGEARSSTARLDMDEKMVYDDPSFAAFMEELSSKPEVETVVMDDEVVHFFDADDIAANPELQSFRKAVEASRPCELRLDLPGILHSRANIGFEYMTSGAMGYYAMFDDNTFSDTHTFYNTGSFYEVHDIPYMSSLGLNDKVSSLAVAYNGSDRNVCAVLTVWEDKSYNSGDNDRTKHRVSFIATYYQPRLSRSNLKNIPCINSGNSWNDRISSASFHFGNYGSYLKDY